MKKLAFLITIILLLTHTSLAEFASTSWAPQGNIVCYTNNGKMGIKTLDDAVLCDAVYDYIGYFDQHGLAEIRLGALTGKMRSDGQIIISPMDYNSIGYFNYYHGGHGDLRDEVLLFSIMQNNELRYGFFSLSGELITDARWEKTYSYKNGIAYVKQNGKWNMINMQGELILSEWWDELYIGEYDRATLITTDRQIQIDEYGMVFAEYQQNTNGKWNLVSIAGEDLSQPVECKYLIKTDDGYYYQTDTNWGLMDKNATPIRFIQCRKISSTKAKTVFQVWDQEKTGLIDTTGNFILDTIYNDISYIADNRWLVRNENTFMLLDSDGKCIKNMTSEKNETLYPVGDGYIQYHSASGEWGFLNSNGIMLSCVDEEEIKPQAFAEYAEGWIEIEMTASGEVGYMYIDGTILSSSEWKTTRAFSNGFAAVRLVSNEKWVYINPNGNPVCHKSWDFCDDYIIGIAGPVARVVQRMDDGGNVFGFIDAKGNLLNGLNPL